ncbi:MAG: Hsp33 family molecular chaperone HslO [Deltaproteobacteria bacterium]
MKDKLLRLTDKNLKIRVFAAQTTNLVEEARKTHNLSPVASAALGRTLTASLMMGMMLKNEDDRLTIQIKGGGPLGGIVVVSNHRGNVKGYVSNPEVYLEANSLGKLDVGGAVGKDGYLNVIKDIGLKEPYIGFIPLVSGEIAEDIAYYFLKSEQIPSAVALGVLVDKTEEVISSGGFIIQLLPKTEENVIEKIEANLQSFSTVTNYLSAGESIENIVKRVTGDMELKILDEIEPEYLCDCSRERMEQALISLGRTELNSILEEEGHVQIECHFCLKKYCFNQEEVDCFMKE